MAVIVRFAPSPTGFLHIGGARTALFNWLFARHHGGQFLLRIEDTDRARSTPESVKTILEGLTWLGLDWDGEAVSQFARRERHVAVAHELVARGAAYRCYASPAELEALRAEQTAKGLPQRYDGRWRDRPASEAPPSVAPVIRLKAPLTGETTLHDRVGGTITVPNSQLDDMVLLRADGTPTYMLAVVVDDHDMGITHVIRGDDHLTNAFRQLNLYTAMDWTPPMFAHLPLIHGPDGAKFSKRHGSPAVHDYAALGYLPEAMRNYLVRLGWAHGDDEIFSTDQAIAWFNLEGLGVSPARFDFAKLNHLNARYLAQTDDSRLATLAEPFLVKAWGRDLTDVDRTRFLRALPDLKTRSATLVALAESARFYGIAPTLATWEPKARDLMTPEARTRLGTLLTRLEALPEPWTASKVEALFRTSAEEQGLKLGVFAQPFRAALTGSTVSPPIFTVAEIFGKNEVFERVKASLSLPDLA